LAIDETKQAELLTYFSTLALKKGFINLPEGQKFHSFDFTNVKYENIISNRK